MFISTDCTLADYRASTSYTHPFVQGLMLRPIQSKSQYDLAQGIMFFTKEGEIALGYYGFSWVKFKDTTRLWKAAPSSSASRQIETVAGFVHPTTHKFGHKVSMFLENSWADYARSTDGTLSWDEAESALKLVIPNHPDLYGMEIVAFNADDGMFCLADKFGGWMVNRPNTIPVRGGTGVFPVGWLRKRVELAELGRGVQHAYPSMVQGMKSDAKKYFDKAYHSYQRSPQAHQKGHANLLTSWLVDRGTLVSERHVGLASPELYPLPQSLKTHNTGNSSNPLYVSVFNPIPQKIDCFYAPRVVPCADPEGLVIVSDVLTGHCLADAIDFDSGHVIRLTATGVPMDVAMGSIGASYSSGIPDPVITSQPFPSDLDLEGLTPEQQGQGWQSIDLIGPSKENVATICRMPVGVHLFPQLQDVIAGIYKNATGLAKKDAKKKKLF